MRLLSRRLGLLTVVTVAWFVMPLVEVVADDTNQDVIDLFMGELQSGDPERQAGAIAIVRDIPGEATTR